MIEYLLESMLCFAVLCITYEVLFKHSINYKTNRVLLLVIPMFSLLVPLLNISMTTLPIENMDKGKILLESLSLSRYTTTSQAVLPAVENDFFTLSSLFLFIYLSVALVLTLRFVWHLKTLLVKWYKSQKVNCKGHNLSLMEENIPPFTFFQAIFVNSTEYEDGKFKKELFIHEIAHKYQWHSIDIVFIELLHAIFWFNPFIYLLKKRIKMNHEYLADNFVLHCGTSSKEYANQLLDYTFPHKIAGFASPFNNHSTIKNRLLMLSKFQEKRPRVYRLLLLIPIISLLFLSTAFNGVQLLNKNANSQTVQDKLLENPGVIYADNLLWSSEDNKVYLQGENVKIEHGDNNFTLKGRASYLGTVHYLILDGRPIIQDTPISISGFKCIVVKLSPQDAENKFGSNARNGAVEITTVKP